MKDQIVNVSLAIVIIFAYGAMLWLCALLEVVIIFAYGAMLWLCALLEG